jgi:nitrite reductase/ring-hydroxylating ferredoxin subunit
VLLGMGGWMGGTLVNRNLISVDHRYAGAGKWSEARLRAGRDGRVVAARADELEVDQMKLLHVDGRRIVLGRTEDGYVAFDDRCTHRGGSLAGGVMICGTVQCLWHGSQFDCRTGAVRAGPAEEPIRTYEVEEAGGEVRLRLR